MRTFKTILFVGLLGLGTTGCKWTDFDDLESETWVSTTTKPNKDSTDFGIALARGARTSTSGGKLAVFANGEPQYLELGYAANGDGDVSSTVLVGGIAPVADLGAQPIVLADPASDEIALVAGRSSGGVSVLHGTGQLADHAVVMGPSEVTAAAYVKPPGAPAGAAPLVADATAVYGSYFANPTASSCTLFVDDSAIRGLGAAELPGSADGDEVVVWAQTSSSASKLFVFESDVFDGKSRDTLGTADPSDDDVQPCVTRAPVPVASNDIPFAPGRGSHVVMVDATHALLVGHKDQPVTDSYLALYDVSASPPAIVGTAVELPGLRTATLLELGGEAYVVAGYPADTVDGVAGAGHVLVYPLSLTTGLTATPAMELYDAQPEDDQQFGRAVAVTQFNGQPAIAVGADNEVFFYFRTTLYDETRQ